MSTSTNGTSWTPVVRIPIDATSRPVDHFIRKNAAHGALEQVLTAISIQPQIGRNGRRKLHQFVIEKRHTNFDRMGHAHPVHFGQDVQR